MGIVNVPLFELPYTLGVEVNPGYEFQPSSPVPVISSFLNTVGTQPHVTGQEIQLLTPFVFSTARYPTAATTAVGGARNPVWFGNHTWNYNVFADGTNRIFGWTQQTVLGVNTFTKFINQVQIYNQLATYGVEASPPMVFIINREVRFGIILIHNARLDFNALSVDLGGGHPQIDDQLFRFAGIAGWLPRYNIPIDDFYTGEANYMFVVPGVFWPRPNLFKFVKTPTPFDTQAWRTLFFEQSVLNDCFDTAVTPNWATLTNSFSRGHIFWSPLGNIHTPSMLGTVVVVAPDFSYYYLINFVPKSNKARLMLANAVTSWRIKIDYNGVWYVVSNVDYKQVYSSFGLSLPFYWPAANMPVISIPCGGTCVPIPMNIPVL